MQKEEMEMLIHSANEKAETAKQKAQLREITDRLFSGDTQAAEKLPSLQPKMKREVGSPLTKRKLRFAKG